VFRNAMVDLFKVHSLARSSRVRIYRYLLALIRCLVHTIPGDRPVILHSLESAFTPFRASCAR
jgi:hypothetical protein